MNKSHHMLLAAADLGIPWLTILAWLEQYGFPVVIKVLTALFSGSLTGLTPTQIITWCIAALAAAASGQPLPPLPTP